MAATLELPLVAALASLIVACGGTDDPENSGFSTGTTCGLDLEASGAAQLTVSPTASVGCLTQHSSGPGINVVFFLTEGAVETTSLRVNVDKAQTGTGFDAGVGVTPRDAEELEAAGCVAEVTANESVGAVEMGHRYRVTGEVRDDGRTNPGEDPIIIERLRFVASITWAD